MTDAVLPECPQCGRAIHRAEPIGESAFVEPCGHFIAAAFFEPRHVDGSGKQELVADGGERRKTEFWGYEQHHRSVRDVVDEDRWHDEEQWAIDEALGYARVISVPSSTFGACHLLQQPFIDHFEAMLDGFLHKPLDICTATKRTQKTEQTTLCDGGQSEERHCTTCGKSLDGTGYELWLFYTCRSCSAEPAPGRWSAGMAPGTAVKWAYTPRWHIDEHPESNHHIVADGGVVREDLSTFGGSVDHGPHVSLVDCAAAVRAAGIDEPPLTDPVRAWREFEMERNERVFRTTLYAVRRACPDAPTAPPAEPPETDYAFGVVEDDGPEQATLADLTGGESA